MAKIKTDNAMPLRGYSLMDNSENPDIVGLRLETDAGPLMVVVNQEILALLGEAFTHKAQAMAARAKA